MPGNIPLLEAIRLGRGVAFIFGTDAQFQNDSLAPVSCRSCQQGPFEQGFVAMRQVFVPNVCMRI